MINDWREYEFEELPFMDWKLVSGNSYATTITKNGRKYRAQLFSLQNSWRLKLTQENNQAVILELRFRNVSQEDAMTKAEYYILEYII